MSGFRLPNFHGCRAHIAHPDDHNAKALSERLAKVGMLVEVAWPAERLEACGFDIILFHVDQGHDGMFSWKPGESPVPLIALLGSEAPGRLEWALSQLPAAYLVKPIGSTGVFSALAIAFHTFELRRQQEERIARLRHKVDARPVVLNAVQMIMRLLKVDEPQAFRLLRDESMRQRHTIESLSRSIVEKNSLAPLGDMARQEMVTRRDAGT